MAEVDEMFENRLRLVEQENIELRGEIKLLRQELYQLRESLGTLNKVLSKILWIITGGFLSSLVAWMLNGGLIK